MTVSRRLLMRSGRSGIVPVPIPAFTASKEATNPVVEYADNPNENDEQYVPAPIKVGSTYWVFVKGNFDEYAWSSADGVSFTLANGNNPIIAPVVSTWEAYYALEAAVTYDPDTDTVHYWYKGTTVDGGNFSIGHATAPGSDPTDVTKDAGNPILTNAAARTALGGTIVDLAISDVFKIGSTVHFFGYLSRNSRYKLFHGTGSDWDDIGNLEIIGTATADANVIQNPSVFRIPGSGVPRYGMFYSDGTIANNALDTRRIRFAHSLNLSDWTYPGTEILRASETWEQNRVYACSVLKSGYGLDPIEDGSGRWYLYYSGSTIESDGNSGLAYVEVS